MLSRPAKTRRHIGFRLALVINLLVTLGVGIGTAPFIGGAFGSNSLKGMDFGSTPIWRPFTPFNEENVTRTNQPVPEGSSGVWVTLIGQGGNGSSSNGGKGGGGGAYVARTFIPASSLEATYTVERTPNPDIGTAGWARFSSGAVSLAAGNGLHGAATKTYGTGGLVTAVGVSAAAGSGPGGDGGDQGSAGSNAVGGGGGGGGASTSGFGAVSGGKGGSSTTSGGGAGSSGASGSSNASNGSNGTLSPGRPGGGGGGAGTNNNFGFQQSGNAGDGGRWGAGGGGRGSGTGGTTGTQGTGGLAYTLLEWE